MFTMCTCWFIHNCKKAIEGKGIYRAECNASSTAITQIVIYDEKVLWESGHRTSKGLEDFKTPTP